MHSRQRRPRRALARRPLRLTGRRPGRVAPAAVLVAAAALAAAVGAAVVSAGSSAAVPGRSARAAAAATTVVHLDGARLGPAFQGIGAIAGGGGNARYLVDYPAPQRNAILDYLFKPHYGASLQLLKLEIGGGGNSSDGSEPSVEQVRGKIDCNVGYEFWLAKQAVQRNPSLALYGLQWSAPAWVRGARDTIWTSADIRYLLDWLGCARRAGLRISYLGGWNEHYSVGSATIENWYVALRRALDQNGYRSVKIVAADEYGAAAWAVADDMSANKAFGRAVAVIGVHDVCGLESDGFRCNGSGRAKAWAASGHKLLWHSELGRTPRVGSTLLEEGPASLARSLNRGYIDAAMTATLLWPLVEAMPPYLPYTGRGLVAADQPWSGHYSVDDLTWVVAQTTQFVSPGWRFLSGGDGQLAGGGTYVAYAAPNHAAWSMVVETSTATASQRLTVDLGGGLPTRVHVWLTQLNGRRQLVEVASTVGSRRSFSFDLAPGALYTFTTTSGQSKAGGRAPAVPSARKMPASYVARPDLVGMASLLAPVEGSFQYVGGTLTQTTVGTPVAWASCDVGYPYAVLGDGRSTQVTIATSVELPSTPPGGRPRGAFLVAGFDGRSTPCDFSGYVFSVDSSGRWSVAASADLTAVRRSGRVTPSQHYDLALSVSGRHIEGRIDGRQVVAITARSTVRGLVGIGSLSFDPVRYRSLTVHGA